MTHVEQLHHDTDWMDDGTPEFAEWQGRMRYAAAIRDIQQEIEKPFLQLEYNAKLQQDMEKELKPSA